MLQLSNSSLQDLTLHYISDSSWIPLRQCAISLGFCLSPSLTVDCVTTANPVYDRLTEGSSTVQALIIRACEQPRLHSNLHDLCWSQMIYSSITQQPQCLLSNLPCVGIPGVTCRAPAARSVELTSPLPQWRHPLSTGPGSSGYPAGTMRASWSRRLCRPPGPLAAASGLSALCAMVVLHSGRCVKFRGAYELHTLMACAAPKEYKMSE